MILKLLIIYVVYFIVWLIVLKKILVERWLTSLLYSAGISLMVTLVIGYLLWNL